MSAEVLLDTNILVYAFDHRDPRKRGIASSLADPRSDRWEVSWQVIQEFCSAALHRFKIPMPPGDLNEYLDLVLLPVAGSIPRAKYSARRSRSTAAPNAAISTAS